jgi:hypothetical protein
MGADGMDYHTRKAVYHVFCTETLFLSKHPEKKF